MARVGPLVKQACFPPMDFKPKKYKVGKNNVTHGAVDDVMVLPSSHNRAMAFRPVASSADPHGSLWYKERMRW